MSSIHIEQNGVTRTLSVPADETLLSALRRAGYSIPAACGGKGLCGKCRVPVNGVPRLACRVYPADGDTVTLPESAGGAILTRTLPPPACQPGRTGCAAAVDLGTTTVAVRLYDRADGCALGTDAAWNAQAAYGADVISRIQYTLERADGLRELSERIRAQVWALIRGLLKKAGRGKGDLREVVLAGNTAMQLLFTGHSVRGLAAAPFLPETLFRGDAEACVRLPESLSRKCRMFSGFRRKEESTLRALLPEIGSGGCCRTNAVPRLRKSCGSIRECTEDCTTAAR